MRLQQARNVGVNPDPLQPTSKQAPRPNRGKGEKRPPRGGGSGTAKLEIWHYRTIHGSMLGAPSPRNPPDHKSSVAILAQAQKGGSKSMGLLQLVDYFPRYLAPALHSCRQGHIPHPTAANRYRFHVWWFVVRRGDFQIEQPDFVHSCR